MKNYILSIDPGKLSGFVLLSIRNFPEQEPKVLKAEEYTQIETCNEVIKVIEDHYGDLEIVMEDFIITTETAKKKTDRWYSLEIIGAIRYFAEANKIPFTLQSPAAAKSFVTNERIRNLGLWVAGGQGHHHDAMRHAILYIVQRTQSLPKGLLS